MTEYKENDILITHTETSGLPKYSIITIKDCYEETSTNYEHYGVKIYYNDSIHVDIFRKTQLQKYTSYASLLDLVKLLLTLIDKLCK